MSKYTDDELYQALTETGRLLKGVAPAEGEAYSLDDILAEFGQEGAAPALRPEDIPDMPAPVPVPAPENPAEQPASEEPPPTEASLLDTQRLRKVVAENMEKAMGPAPDPVPVTTTRREEKRSAPPPAAEETVRKWEKPPRALKENRPPAAAEKAEAAPEPVPAEQPALELIRGGLESEAAPEEEPTRDSSVFPEEPEGMHEVPLEQVMSQTVESILDEDDGILESGIPLGQRVREAVADWRERLSARTLRRQKEAGGATEEPTWEQPRRKEPEVREEPEPDMEEAARDEKRLCKRLHRHTVLAALPTLALMLLAVLDAGGVLDGLWSQHAALRSMVSGGLLLLAALLATPVWKELTERLRRGRVGCEMAAAFATLAVLADCVYGALGHGGGHAPFAAPAAVLLWVCQYGLRLRADGRREAFHLADIGGTPPYGVAVTAAGACKQKGKLEGFYNMTRRDDPPRRWQAVLVPLYLTAATVLAGVAALSGGRTEQLLWIWSALLTAGLPASLALTGALPLRYLNGRLAKSGSAVAGYAGARLVSRSRRMVVTDDDLFPPGTVGLNGLKVYGEEIGKVVSYAASMTMACQSQLQPLFEQLLTAEGGVHMAVEDLHYYEEGGVGGTIRGESVTMGSAYFMRKSHVTLPQELKLKTGVFLAVDGALIAIFAIKYQPSRNVEWALRAMRRNRIEPVLAVRSSNVTPGLLKRKFNLDTKPVYPDVSTRLALSDLSRETAEQSGAIIYRDGLMPFAETAVGSRRMVRAMRCATALAYVGGLCGLLLGYYLTGVGAFTLLDPLRMLLFQGLWLLPTWLLSGLVKHY